MTKHSLGSPQSAEASVDSGFSNDSYRSSASSNSATHQPYMYHRPISGNSAGNLERVREASVDSGVSSNSYGVANHPQPPQIRTTQRQRSASADTRNRPKSAGYRLPSKPVLSVAQLDRNNNTSRPKSAGYKRPPPSPQLNHPPKTAPSQGFHGSRTNLVNNNNIQQAPMNGLQNNPMRCKSMEYLNASGQSDTDSGLGRSRTSQKTPKNCPKNLPPPLTTTRLKPLRKEGSRGNNCFYILEDGWVVLEFIKIRSNPGGGENRYVTEVFKVSSDGMKIISYCPYHALVSETPAPEPMDMSKVRVFDYLNLPEKYWKKYKYISNFIDMVKGKTPKVTKYTQDQLARCILMENANFEAHFYDGKSSVLYDCNITR